MQYACADTVTTSLQRWQYDREDFSLNSSAAGRERASTAPRLKDVALLAGVSIRTVSNVVNGYAPVSAPMRTKVESAVEELGYRPNALARNLKRGRTGVLALVVPELDVPYFAELARAVITEARQRGYTVVIDQTDGDSERERELILHDARAALFDGVIFSPLALSDAELTSRDDRLPMVLLGERKAGSPFDHVAIDNAMAARDATEHLFGIGRRRLAAIGDQPTGPSATAELRTAGFRDAHARLGHPLDENLVISCRNYHRADGARAVAGLLANSGAPFDSLFCYSDLLALGALRELHSHGKRVPEDVAIVGFDDIEDGQFSIPTLTTIQPDKQQIAELAVGRLVARIEGMEVGEPAELVASHRLAVRESTAPNDNAKSNIPDELSDGRLSSC